MIPPLPHRIMRERIEVEFFQCAEPLVARQRIEELCTGPLAVGLDRALSALDVAPDELISIDRLELNVDGLTEHNLETELIPRIISALDHALRKHLTTLLGSQTRPISRSVLEEICFFLERGFLPWPISDAPQWKVGAAQVLASAPVHELSVLLRSFTSSSARIRFARHFPSVLRSRILPELWPTADLELLLEDTEILLLSTLAPGAADIRLRNDILAILLKHAILRQGGTGADLDFAARAILDRVLQERPLPLLSRLTWSSRSMARVARELRVPREQPAEPGVSGRPEPPAAPDSRRQARALQGSSQAADVLIFIENAGLVIVAPYLPTLFAQLGFEQQGTILRPAEALTLVHYLVFGTPECSEWDLVLGKILCGISVEETVSVPCELLPEHMAEADALLRGLIQNWPALKNTSVDGLRETFLQREGVLTREAIGWKLRVERKAPDVLLDTLPWTISMLRLPWMECMLTTDWA